MHIQTFTFGPFQTNTYVITIPSREGVSCLLIDPACSNEYERQQLQNYIDTLLSGRDGVGLSIIATHGHLDHLWGAHWACEQWHTSVLMHPADIPMAQAMQQQYDMFGIRATAQPFPIDSLKSSIINLKFEIISTPGHTPGSICLYWPDDNVLISGDTLFHMGYGRTDLPGGNTGQLIDSLEHLFTLPPATRVYPGHGDTTTIAAERRY